MSLLKVGCHSKGTILFILERKLRWKCVAHSTSILTFLGEAFRVKAMFISVAVYYVVIIRFSLLHYHHHPFYVFGMSGAVVLMLVSFSSFLYSGGVALLFFSFIFPHILNLAHNGNSQHFLASLPNNCHMVRYEHGRTESEIDRKKERKVTVS